MSTSPDPASSSQEAVLAGGCFWCTEGCFQLVKGVISVTSGYTGGMTEKPTYEQICTGRTGHAEAIKVEFDPAIVSFQDLLEIFWVAHDPTTLNRQGADVGTQYRSAIFYASEEQRKAAEASKAAHEGDFDAPIVTEISPLGRFYPAEGYHQNFANNHPDHGYICAVAAPKMQKVRKKLAGMGQ